MPTLTASLARVAELVGPARRRAVAEAAPLGQGHERDATREPTVPIQVAVGTDRVNGGVAYDRPAHLVAEVPGSPQCPHCTLPPFPRLS